MKIVLFLGVIAVFSIAVGIGTGHLFGWLEKRRAEGRSKESVVAELTTSNEPSVVALRAILRKLGVTPAELVEAIH